LWQGDVEDGDVVEKVEWFPSPFSLQAADYRLQVTSCRFQVTGLRTQAQEFRAGRGTYLKL